jgi:hypothetical protein
MTQRRWLPFTNARYSRAVSKRISPRDPVELDGRHNYCFIDLATPEQAQAAVDALNGMEFDGNVLKFSIARERTERRGMGTPRRFDS